MKPVFIAEIGINHHGSMEKAFRMIKKAKDCGADYAKLQYYIPEKVLGKSHPEFQYATQCYLSKPQHETLKNYCDLIGIEYLVSVFDVKDVKWAASLCKAMKVATRMNMKDKFLEAVYQTNRPTFMSVQPGIPLDQKYADSFMLMWCIPRYPSQKVDVLQYPYKWFGLSSHCPDWTASFEAYKLGSRIFENHVCESRDELGCDISSSLTFDEYKQLINACA